MTTITDKKFAITKLSLSATIVNKREDGIMAQDFSKPKISITLGLKKAVDIMAEVTPGQFVVRLASGILDGRMD